MAVLAGPWQTLGEGWELGELGSPGLGCTGDVLGLQRAQQMPGLALPPQGYARVHFTPGGCRRFGEISLPHYPW